MGRELTAREKRLINQSVIRRCANYDSFYQICLPEDATCYMMTIGFSDTPLCRYYKKAILPIEFEVAEIFENKGGVTGNCRNCGKRFLVHGNQKYCSAQCADIARKKADAKRHKIYRQNMRR